MDVKTKDMFVDVGVVKKMDINGMVVFEMPLLGKDKKTTGESELSKLAVKGEKGDRVVRLEGKPRSFMVIPQKEWAEMPATKAAAAKEMAAKATPQLADLAKKINDVASENVELKKQIAALSQPKDTTPGIEK